MNIQTDKSYVNLILINDGKIITENLNYFGLDETFLRKSLARQNITDVKSVMIYTLNPSGSVYLQQKNGKKIVFEEKLG